MGSEETEVRGRVFKSYSWRDCASGQCVDDSHAQGLNRSVQGLHNRVYTTIYRIYTTRVYTTIYRIYTPWVYTTRV